MADMVIPLTGRERDIVVELLGMMSIVVELEKALKTLPTLPGLNLAFAVAQKCEAQQRVIMASAILRKAAAAGVDVVSVESIYTEQTKDGLVIRIAEGDLLSRESK